ncbi:MULTISPECIES: alpha/beta-type small acid-soluble spore protein [Sporosarcina]|uniref:Alpha/beta-type small acid-soluble spore protein n=1 Tax=Sporosarcina contaminans TaxID=633403 RepID=A0ABW3TWI7_9BACL
MAKKNKLLVPEAKSQVDQLKCEVMRSKGYRANCSNPDSIKFEVAEELGIPLSNGNNGNLTAEQAGKIGGTIGGSMVKEMVRLAEKQLKENR